MAGFSVYTSGYPLSGVPTGATWGVDITGVAPGAKIVISQSRNDGTPVQLLMGNADNNGNWSYRAILGNDVIGTWHSTWYADGVAVGSYVFVAINSGYGQPSYTLESPGGATAVYKPPETPTTISVTGNTVVNTGAIGPGTGPISIPTETTVADFQPGVVLQTVTQSAHVQAHFAGAGVGALLGGLSTGPIGVVIGIATIIGDILGSLFGGIFGGSDYGKQIAGINAAIVNLSNAITADLDHLHRWVAKILDFLKTLLIGIVTAIVNLLRKILNLIKHLVTEIIPNILKAIQEIRQKIMEVYRRIIRPILIILQDVRKVLAILKLFHIKWAAKLDAVLADVQRRITTPLFFLLRYVNTVANYINLILTARLILQKGLFLNSLQAYQGSSIGILYNAQSQPISAADQLAITQANSLPTTQQSAQNGTQYLLYNTGPYQPIGDQASNQFLTYLQSGL